MRSARHGGEARKSALWGRGSKSELRSSALWGRRGGRLSATVAALAVALAIPAAGVAASNGHGNGNGNTNNGNTNGNLNGIINGNGAPISYHGHGWSPGVNAPAVVPPDLLADATANPTKQFKVIIEGTDGTRSDNLAASAQSTGGHGVHVRRRFQALNGASLTLPGSIIVKLQTYSTLLGIKAIVPDAPVAIADTASGPFDGYLSQEIWRQSAGVTPFLDAQPAANAPAIAIVDSGIDSKLTGDFGNRVIARTDFTGDGASNLDPEGHGTMVAGVAAGSSASYPGAAPSANLVDVRVANSQGEADTSNVIAGLDWVLQNKDRLNIRVVNLSLAGTSETSFQFDPLDQAVEKLWVNGVVVVAAAGNNGSADGPVPMAAPGNDPFVITVGATDPNQTADASDDFRAPWSAYGYTADGFLKPELSAPGRYMVAPVSSGSYLAATDPARVLAPGYMWMSGTSFAAPVAAGAAADILALHPEYTPDQVKGALMLSATSVSHEGMGVGQVNVAAAAQVASPPNPNEGLDAFVSTDPTTGLQTFTVANWVSAVSTSANWTNANWTSANWTSANWTAANWTSANWTSANWTSANWTSANWTSANWTSANWTAANWVR